MFKPFQQFIASSPDFAVICHHRPDGDAIGSLLSLGCYLEGLGKKIGLYCFDSIPAYLNFLPGTERIKKECDDFWQAVSSVILVDCGDLAMVGGPADCLKGKRLAVIDHHISNPRYGEVNLIDPQVSATTELLGRFFQAMNFGIDKNLATCLLTGLYTDTDAFSNLATTPEALSMASLLLKQGANFKEITANTLQNKSIPALKLWGRALERLRLDTEKGIAVTVIRDSDLIECQAQVEDTEGIASLLNHLADVKMSMVLREQGDGTVKGSLRTTNELIDVSKIAKLLGGGGHMKAAGFLVKGHVLETEKGWKIVE
ncbi:MAG: bifunctional oligoribonuclease/PAP phosphatase NrnA [Candidatus Komeilibacteria bacterium]|nr:bifunctional oligoribonuclease/PAP phosphatase NrnA [Candidatus Komeilibacteria bacterium]